MLALLENTGFSKQIWAFPSSEQSNVCNNNKNSHVSPWIKYQLWIFPLIWSGPHDHDMGQLAILTLTPCSEFRKMSSSESFKPAPLAFDVNTVEMIRMRLRVCTRFGWAAAVVRYGWIVSAPTYHKLPYRHLRPPHHHTIPSHPKTRLNICPPNIPSVHSCNQPPLNNAIAIACQTVLKQQLHRWKS